MESQITNVYRRAFKDSINQNIHSDTPDFDWIVNLYAEIKKRLMHLVKKESETYNELNESFDVELFRQMLTNNVFNSDDMAKLVENTYSWIKRLHAPFRDKYLTESKKKVLETDYKEIIGVFVIEVNNHIDNIYLDMSTFYGTLR